MFGGVPVDDPDGELCADCGAGLDEPCSPDCECSSCEKRREREPDEPTDYDREQQAEIQRTLK